MNRPNASRGFTLIELLVVISIIGLLSSIVMASLNAARAQARDARRQADIRQVYSALELYFLDYNEYPSTGGLDAVYMDPGCDTAGASDTISENWVPGLVESGYMPALPKDPRGENAVGSTVAGGACYMYASDGAQFVLSAWGTVEHPVSSGGLYSREGFRETGWNVQDARHLCNHSYIGSLGYYEHSYTISNVPCTW